jgi:hypothetical protein
LAKPITSPALRELEATALRVLFEPARPSTREEDAQLLAAFANVMHTAGRVSAETEALLADIEAEKAREHP